MTFEKIKAIKTNKSVNNSQLHNSFSASKINDHSAKLKNKSPSPVKKNVSQYTTTSPKFYREKEIQMQESQPKR